MLNENAKKWVTALRSGKYSQGRGMLRKEDTFCCLGVACDLYARETGAGLWKATNTYMVRSSFVLGEERANEYLPPAVQEWLGLATGQGEYDGNIEPLSHSLSHRNDDGASFGEIADIIESQPEGLFAK